MAAIAAAATFCAGALANAAPLDLGTVQGTINETLTAGLTQPGSLDKGTTTTSGSAIGSEAGVAPPAIDIETPRFASLADAVEAQPVVGAVADAELQCLATGVYYEAKGEPLAGQLAVAEVILDRADSGRFPGTVCSVLTQRGQFSFVRAGRLPTPPVNAAFRKAMAVARVAKKDLWASPVDGALYFHARYVRPGWKRARLGAVGNHIFYR